MKTKGKTLKLLLVVLVGASILLPAGWILTAKLEGGAPALSLEPSALTIGSNKVVTVSASDEKSGLRRMRIDLFQNGKELILLEKDFPGGSLFRGGDIRSESIEVQIDPAKLGISDGNAVLRMTVRDYSWRRWWHGNKTYRELDVLIDTKPPKIDVLTRVHNISQGGTGVVIYRLSEPCPRSGVAVGDNFFPGHIGHFDDKLKAMAFFALDTHQGKGTPLSVQARDRGGNTASERFPHHIRRRRFKKDTIRISDRFLEWKMPEFADQVPEAATGSPVEKFIAVNRSLRKSNYLSIQNIGSHSEAQLMWEGRFLRLPNAANRAGFGDRRDYRYNDKIIDQQIHLGIDLASVAHSPVPAANSGKVVFADDIGIYGKSILIDHGFGLFSMYSHLSGIDVQTGQTVSKKEIIGRTGTSGLAGGDHLHFSIMVHNTFVNPVEWWDGTWIRNNITTKIDAAGPGTG